MPILKCKRKKTEHIIQKSIVRWFRKEYPEYLLFSTNNEACYNNNYYLESGVLSGVSDLIVVLPNKIIFVELKAERGIQSKSQKEFETKLISLGYEYFLIRSLESFKELIMSILEIKKNA
ncbi:MAG: VRR-NUC domain-containing protein [Bacteroidales bacterium]|nr:VRR-NUC domain-containing protein [Bacteroidales bacterium]